MRAVDTDYQPTILIETFPVHSHFPKDISTMPGTMAPESEVDVYDTLRELGRYDFLANNGIIVSSSVLGQLGKYQPQLQWKVRTDHCRLMAATWMARLGVSTRIVDKRGTKIFSGQADGLQCRSLEIFDSFGFADRVWKESNHMLEICMWVC